LNAVTRLVLVLLLCPQFLIAQSFLEQFSYEGLRFSGIGFEFGGVVSNRLTREMTPAVRIDYGRIAPNVRVLIGASYFKGDFKPGEIEAFESGLERVVQNPPPDLEINVGPITWTNIEVDLDLQYMFEGGGRITNYVGVGIAAFLRNGTGVAIEDTFVEDALDAIDAGINVSVGTAIEIIPAIQITIDLRGGLSGEMRAATARSGLMFRLPGGG